MADRAPALAGGGPRFAALARAGAVPAALEAGGLAAILAAAGWAFAALLHTATNYDEGNYLAALTDLRHGYVLGRDVYPDQPPGWYLLLRLDAFLFGNSVTGVRTGLLVLSLLGVAAAWACARRLGPLPALGAAAVVAVAPPYPSQAAQVGADTPAAVLALCALALAAWAFRERTSRPLALAAGAVLACAVSVKLSALTAVLPFAALAVLARGRFRNLAWPLLGAAVVFAAQLIAFSSELGPVLHGVVGQHASALGSSRFSRSANVHRLVHFLDWHTPFAWLVVGGVAASLAFAFTRRERLLGALWLFVPAAAAFILAMKPLLDHHLVILAVALAVPVGAALGLAAASLRRDAAAVLALGVAVFVAAGVYQQHRQLHRDAHAEPDWILWAADRLRAVTAPHEVVATDIPIVAYYAHRDLVPDLVDTSFTRVDVGDLRPARVFRELDRYHVRAAALGRALYAVPAVRAGFAARFRQRIPHEFIVLYLGRRAP